MEKVRHIPVRVGAGYEVTVGAGLLDGCGARVKAAVGACRAAVVTDSNVEKLYLERVLKSLADAGMEPVCYAFPAGERNKNLQTLSDILEFLAENRLTRKDCVVALGGGVTGDMAGFAAGCYLRGVKVVQLPTTLLAAVDASVGGKTAVDLKAGKNLAGLFLQPSAVICDTDCLRSLPDDVFADGASEAVKTGILAGEPLFSLLEKGGARENAGEIIARCAAFKAQVVEQDEREGDLRRILNLGHTLGHAIEKCSDYSVAHGRAVAMGTVAVSRAAVRMGKCEKAAARRIEAAFIKNGLPVELPYPAEQLCMAALSDKKRAGGNISVVLPKGIGEWEIMTLPVAELRNFIDLCTEE